MRQKYWIRIQKWFVPLSCGGMTLGVLQGFELLNWASMFTQLLATWLTVLVTLLLGGDVSTMLGTPA